MKTPTCMLVDQLEVFLKNPSPPELFWSSWAWGGGLQKPSPLHKSESINAIVKKLGG